MTEPALTRTTTRSPRDRLDGAASALEMCAREYGCETVFPDALAKAAVIAYLNLSGRDAEAEEMSRVGT